ncbi:thimet oligopeptidase [Fusarium longipes]|uniref:Thimet oligopeptidase n=1 Tax=Fusarium longipes TaxID=694270 RepID=A0A395T816_9HYPO|nr:thimet oligopeptidase [Fusarium longipes]
MSNNKFESQASTNYKEAFALFDKRGNGRVTVDSLGDLLRACGQNPTLAEIQDLEKNVGGECEYQAFATMDIRTGADFIDTVDFETFQRVLNRPGGFRDPGEPEEYCRGFQVFDKDMTGFIGVGQLKYILTNLGEKMTDEEVDELLKAVDTSSGQVNYTGTLFDETPLLTVTFTSSHPSKLDKRASRRPLLLLLLSLFFLLVAVTLASSRAFSRLGSLANHFRFQAPRTILSRRQLVTSTMAPDKYRNPPQAPPLFTATPESIAADTKKLCDATKNVLDSVAANVTADKASFANVLEPILIDENLAATQRRILTFYHHVSTNKELRDASTESERVFNDFGIECNMREDIFNAVDAAFANRASQDLTKEQAHVLEKERNKYIRNGLRLPAGPKRDRFKEIQKRLSELEIQGQTNLNEEKGAIWFTPEELKGVPADDIDVDSLEKGTGENEGKVKLSFKYNHYFPLIKYAINADTRRKYTVAESNKANVNVPIFQEIITLRDEAARLLGYDNHAALRIEEKMAKSPEAVRSFLDDLRSRLAEGGAREINALKEYKKKDYEERGLSFDDSFYMWDTSFYSRIQKEKEYSVDEAKISQYFPVESTFAGMLKIFEEIFGFVFVELKPEERARLSPTGKAEDIVWHEDVLIYSVWDDEASGSSFNGYLYLDLHPRDNKYGHNANFNLEPGYVTEDGKKHYPVTALVCNFSKPTPKKPSLLKHHEVVTLFHELGHGIHDLAGRTRYSYFHGTSTVLDFVEAPSQMLENWCWTPSVLKSLSKHWETKEQIPDELIEKLVSTKRLNSAIGALGQLTIGLFDMTVHTPESHEAVKKLNAGRTWNELRHEISGTKGPEDLGEGLEWGNRHAGIGHFIGGYDAGYYGYLYSEVFSLDMFHSFFAKNPMDGKEGRRYRHTVLERGGSIPEMEFLKEFLGREPSSEAFYKELGLSSSAS